MPSANDYSNLVMNRSKGKPMPHQRRSNAWAPPTGERFVRIYGGELDGLYHSSLGWYESHLNNGNLDFLVWMEAEDVPR